MFLSLPNFIFRRIDQRHIHRSTWKKVFSELRTNGVLRSSHQTWSSGIVLVVSTAIHPSREAPMDNPAIFLEYAQSDGWIAIHFAQWAGVLLLFGGFVALYYSITTKPEAAAGVARFGFGAAVLAAASLTMLQAID